MKRSLWNVEGSGYVHVRGYDKGRYPVAKAVQCSCTFPFVFRPVDDRYVDGGVLSNLPTIVFPERAVSHHFSVRSFKI